MAGAGSVDDPKERLWAELGKGQWGPFARDLVKATPTGRLLRFPMYSRKPFGAWSKGRVVLLGDAAHAPLPTIGQGLNMALEDGWALGAELADSFRAVPGAAIAPLSSADMQRRASSAFAAYERIRKGKTSRMVHISRLLLTLESGIKAKLLAALRTSLVAASLEGTINALRAQIQEGPVVNPDSLHKVRG